MKCIALLNDDKKELSRELREVFEDKTIRHKYNSLETYLNTNKLKCDKDELSFIRKSVIKELETQLSYCAYLHYFILDRAQNWGVSGEQQIKISIIQILIVNLLNQQMMI